MKKKIIITISLVALIVTGTVIAFAATHQLQRQHRFAGRGFEGNADKFIERMLKRAAVVLDLTEAQKQQIKAVLEAEKPVVQPLLKDLATNRQALLTTTDNGQFNEADVQTIATKQGQTLAQLIVEKERVKAQVYAILTPEQRAKAEKLRAHFEERIHEQFTK